MITESIPSLSYDEEKILVERAQSGDQRATNHLIKAHYQQMFHLALKVTRDPVKAEDVTQEACLQVLRRIDQFRSEARFGSWLSRIVVNTALLRHRRERRLVPTDEIYAPSIESEAPAPDKLAADRQLLFLTDSVLNELREGDRELFVRRFIDGLSLKNLSDETGLSLPALKSRFHRARLRIKEVQDRMSWGSVVMA
ncbi:RNA polymerase sigma factor [Myxococcota bacterium]|nr:RNA polymerase sigma factor [Myxococcota bacterium]MBU1433241.1 RNA polymerase sigma factor [Myxococcota bacterium]MBU1898907.1 RNA polymerase sigma factor [Myxococcota bacterium]